MDARQDAVRTMMGLALQHGAVLLRGNPFPATGADARVLRYVLEQYAESPRRMRISVAEAAFASIAIQSMAVLHLPRGDGAHDAELGFPLTRRCEPLLRDLEAEGFRDWHLALRIPGAWWSRLPRRARRLDANLWSARIIYRTNEPQVPGATGWHDWRLSPIAATSTAVLQHLPNPPGVRDSVAEAAMRVLGDFGNECIDRACLASEWGHLRTDALIPAGRGNVQTIAERHSEDAAALMDGPSAGGVH